MAVPNYDFDLDLPLGQEAEDALRRILNGKWEVKRDRQAASTGNVAIEWECRGRPSGLAQSPAEWWGIMLDGPGYDMEVCVLIRADRLRALVSDIPLVSGGDRGLARMALLPVAQLLRRMRRQRP